MKKDSRTEPDYRLVVVLTAAFVAAFGLAVWLWLAGRPPGEGSAEAGFARDMMFHHAQAVEMAEIVRDRTDSDDVRILAADIALGQQAQIGIMQGWLGAWDLPVTGSEPAMAWMGHPTTDGLMPGMAISNEIERLSELSPERADVLFLRLMIAHHEAAIPMAQAILERTDEPEVRELARAIEWAQRAEIGNMKAMLSQKVGDSAEADLEPENGSGTEGTATLSKVEGGVKVLLEVSGLPERGTMYLAHVHPGTCGEEEEGGGQGYSAHAHRASEHGGSKEIEYPLSPVYSDERGEGSSTTVLRKVTFEGLLTEAPVLVNVHAPSSGNPHRWWPAPTSTKRGSPALRGQRRWDKVPRKEVRALMDMGGMVDRCINAMGSMMGMGGGMMGTSIMLIVLMALLLIWAVGLGAVGALIFWGFKRLSRSHP